MTNLRGPDGQPYLPPGSYTPGTNDPATQAATSRFQADQAAAGIVQDGKIGRQTTAALNAALEAQGHDPSSMRTDAAALGQANAARQAEIHNFIMSLPQGYDTIHMLANAWGLVGDPRNFKAVCDQIRVQRYRVGTLGGHGGVARCVGCAG